MSPPNGDVLLLHISPADRSYLQHGSYLQELVHCNSTLLMLKQQQQQMNNHTGVTQHLALTFSPLCNIPVCHCQDVKTRFELPVQLAHLNRPRLFPPVYCSR